MIYLLVSNLAHFEATASESDVRLLDLIVTVDDGGAHRTRDAVVVGLAQATERGDARLDEVVLSEVGDTLLGDHDVRSHSNNLIHRK